jgi:phosphoglycolate phosphatase-like HAD superfamily hydrolase
MTDHDMLKRQHEAMTYPYGKPEARFRTGANKPVVALDIDGTLGDYHKHFLAFAENWFGRPMPHPEEARHGVRLSTFIGASHREYRECKLAYRQGGLKRWMPCYPYASDLTRNIRKAGAQVWICTTRPYMRLDNVDPDTREWLRRNLIEYDAVIYDGIHEEEDDNSKYFDLVDQVGLARIIAVCDDLPEQVQDAQRQGIGQIYLRDQPYNRAPDIPGLRVNSLRDLWENLEIDIDIWKG